MKTEKGTKYMTEKEKYKQCDKEAIITVVVFTIYALWWYFTGFGLNSLGVDALPWIMGLPMWFFLSCIVGWIGCCILVAFVIKFFFIDIDLGNEADNSENAKTHDKEGIDNGR